MPANYVLLGEVTVGAAGAASVTLANIPQTGYTDLKVVASVRSTKADVTDYIYFTFSGSSSYAATKVLFGSGAAAGSFNWSTVSGITGGIINAANNTASTFSSADIYIPNYTSNQFKSVSIDTVQEGNTSSDIYATMMAGLSNSTAAISTITFANESGNFVANSTFYLYGLAAVGTTPVIAPFATGGDIIQNDGTYWIHTFLSSGTFTPQKSLTCDALVIAGGAGAAGYNGGGGGAGGLLTFTSQALTAQGYTVAVGAGGAGGDNSSTSVGTNGIDSQFGILTLVKGGGRSGRANLAGINGGSGGGAGGAGAANSGGTATSGQGNNGGSAPSGGNYPGGGGGGAGAGGANGSGSVSGAGGNGLANSYSGSSVTYAGGGGGGSTVDGATRGLGGTGGGGNGGASGSAGAAGTQSLGAGGGGGAHNFAGGNGGSGIIIVRYPIA